MIDHEGTVLAHAIVGLLNEMLTLDPVATAALINARVPCNDALANHSTIQAGPVEGSPQNVVGILGLLNGLCGVDDRGWGVVAAVVESDGTVSGFKVLTERLPEV